MAARTITQIKEDVVAKLRHDSRVRDFPIDVFDQNGVLILQGTVPSETISRLVEDLVREVDGVVSLLNEVYVKRR